MTTPQPTPDPAPGSRLGRPNDPARRDRIVDACLEVISSAGVAGTSHRKVAARAGVPLGAMTYYFDGMDDLLRESFGRYAASLSDRFDERMAAAADADAARTAVVEHILGGVFGGALGHDREFVLSHELYTLAAREPAFRSITTAWMERSRAALERHFDPVTARLLDALVEGLTIHRALDREDRDPHEVEIAVERITRDGSVVRGN